MTYTVPGMKPDTAQTVITLLQDRLNALNDLALNLKHVHWNVEGPNFIGWDDYSIGRASTLEHLAALDVVYAGLIDAQRAAIEDTESAAKNAKTRSAAKRAGKS